MSASRRSMLRWLGSGVLGLGAVAAAAGLHRFLRPAQLQDLSRQRVLGPASALPAGASHHFADANVHLIHDERGVYALLGRCTHLGCSLLRTPAGFSCPCHGARFDPLGEVLSGPATRPLTWLEVSLTRQRALCVHLDRPVSRGTRLRA